MKNVALGFKRFVEFFGFRVMVSKRSRRQWVFLSTRSSLSFQVEKGITDLKFSTWNQSSTSMVNKKEHGRLRAEDGVFLEPASSKRAKFRIWSIMGGKLCFSVCFKLVLSTVCRQFTYR